MCAGGDTRARCAACHSATPNEKYEFVGNRHVYLCQRHIKLPTAVRSSLVWDKVGC